MSTPTTNKGLAKQSYNENPDTWGTGPLNTALDIIDACLGSMVTISTTGGNTNLTSSQCQNAIINVTGALVSNATITFPITAGGVFIIQNATSGAFTLTAASAGGGSSSAITQSARTIVFTDGTNVKIADDRVGSPSGITNSQLAQMTSYTIKGNATGSTANPTDSSLSTFLDTIGSTRGQVLYRGTSSWSALAVGTAGQALVTNGAGADPSWSSVGASRQGSFANLKILVTSNSAVTLTADAVVAFDGSANYITALSVNVSLSTGTSGAGGIDTGSVSSSTWYHVWVVVKPDGTKSAVLSTSSTSPTLPSGYTMKARVGAVRTDGSSNLYRTLQYGNRAQYVVTAATNTANYPIMASGVSGSVTVPTWSAVATGAFVPPTASAINMLGNSGNGTFIANPNNAAGAYNSSSNPPFVSASPGSGYMIISFSMILESTNVYWAGNISTAVICCTGWVDNL